MNDYYSLPLPTIEESISLIDDFLVHQLIRKVSKSSYDNYHKEAMSYFSILRPCDINQSYINQYIINRGSISASLKNAKNSALRNILKYLLKNGFSNCDLKIHYVKETKKLPIFISEDDMFKLIKKFNNLKNRHRSIWRGKRDYAILLFMYATGLRASEIVRFKMTDLEENWIRVNNGKGSKDRYVPIAKKAVKAIYDYLKYVPMHIKKSCEVVFIADTLNPFDRVTLYNYCKDTFGFNPHLFRHTFATHLILNGCSEYVLMDIMGHSNLSTTQMYTHIQKENLEKTVLKYFPPMQ